MEAEFNQDKEQACACTGEERVKPWSLLDSYDTEKRRRKCKPSAPNDLSVGAATSEDMIEVQRSSTD